MLGSYRTLHVTHSQGGGTWVHINRFCRELRGEGHVALILKYNDSGATILDGDQKLFEISSFSADAVERLVAFLRERSLDFIHFHQIIVADKCIRALPKILDIKYYVTVHDYYYICPQVTCIDATGRYCGLPAVTQCDRCVDMIGPYDGLGAELREHGEQVTVWRNSHAAWLRGAQAVFTPSHDTASRIQQAIDITCTIRPHPEPVRRVRSSVPPRSATLRVVLLGAIGPHKGSDLFLRCATDALLRQLPLTFSVVGEINDPWRFKRLRNVEITKKYPVDCGDEALEFQQYHCALFLSVWPETFAYTLSEVLRAGVFPISLDVGAISERLRAIGWGHLIPLDATPAAINDTLLSLPTLRVPPPADIVVGCEYADYMRDYYAIMSPARPTQTQPIDQLVAITS